MNASRRIPAVFALAVICTCGMSGLAARAQSLAVLPVNVFLSPGQNATSLTVTNHGDKETAIQIRAYAWNQKGDDDDLAPTDAVVVSPPLATIAAGTSQVVRIILRQPPQGREATYRILIDQLPPPAEPGVVHVVLRLSIPIFAQPATRATPDVQFHLERDGEKFYLVGVNDGLHHEAIRDMVLTAGSGDQFKVGLGASPYILAGVTRRWVIAAQGALPQTGEPLRLTAHGDSGAIERQVKFVAAP
jgi:fimbrial chaperone protein